MHKADSMAVLVICDGLCPDWLGADTTPTIDALQNKGLWCADHSSVFPSVTRNAAASITTGCRSVRHGLHGNVMALHEDGRLVVRDVGKPDFRDHMRRATGATLRVPALPERVKPHGTTVVYSNVSPGAAYFLDPDNHGWVYHRAGSFGPGGLELSGHDGLDVSHDMAGDRAMTARFCRDIASRPGLSLAILWLSCPDLLGHDHPLGSPAHMESIRHADACLQRVADTVLELRESGREILLLAGSDHGQETVHDYVDIHAELAEAGLDEDIAQGRIGIAPQGSVVLLYALPGSRDRLDKALDSLSGRPWFGRLISPDQFAGPGQGDVGGPTAAIDMARIGASNPFGVPGMRWGAKNGFSEKTDLLPRGVGIHGGLGSMESRAFLIAEGPGYEPGAALDTPSSLVDIAPTILNFLGLSSKGMEGAPLLVRVKERPPHRNSTDP